MIRKILILLPLLFIAWPMYANSVQASESIRRIGTPLAASFSLGSQRETVVGDGLQTFWKRTADHDNDSSSSRTRSQVFCKHWGEKRDPEPKIAVVPESSTVWLLVIGTGFLIGIRRVGRAHGYRA